MISDKDTRTSSKWTPKNVIFKFSEGRRKQRKWCIYHWLFKRSKKTFTITVNISKFSSDICCCKESMLDSISFGPTQYILVAETVVNEFFISQQKLYFLKNFASCLKKFNLNPQGQNTCKYVVNFEKTRSNIKTYF